MITLKQAMVVDNDIAMSKLTEMFMECMCAPDDPRWLAFCEAVELATSFTGEPPDEVAEQVGSAMISIAFNNREM